MVVRLPTVRFCCGCCPLHTGCLFNAGIFMVMDIVVVSLYAWESITMHDRATEGNVTREEKEAYDLEFPPLCAASCGYLLWLVGDVIFLTGVCLTIPSLVLMWAVLAFLHTLALSLDIVILVLSCDRVTYDCAQRNVASIMSLIANCWLMYACVVAYSYYLEMRGDAKEGLGRRPLSRGSNGAYQRQ